MRQLQFLDAAARNIANLAAYAAAQSGDVRVGRAVAAGIIRQCEKLARLPATLGRPRDELGVDMRSFPAGSHVIFFRYIELEVLQVVDVLHTRQDVDHHFGG